MEELGGLGPGVCMWHAADAADTRSHYIDRGQQGMLPPQGLINRQVTLCELCKTLHWIFLPSKQPWTIKFPLSLCPFWLFLCSDLLVFSFLPWLSPSPSVVTFYFYACFRAKCPRSISACTVFTLRVAVLFNYLHPNEPGPIITHDY